MVEIDDNGDLDGELEHGTVECSREASLGLYGDPRGRHRRQTGIQPAEKLDVSLAEHFLEIGVNEIRPGLQDLIFDPPFFL